MPERKYFRLAKMLPLLHPRQRYTHYSAVIVILDSYGYYDQVKISEDKSALP
ncbi:hypothetical protein C1A50_4619 [Paenibacillus polymyxa]|nr:hypothetical protein C1A50_4619 [Paenibacillus polymyxa]